MSPVEFSVVVPLHNEEENVLPLVTELEEVMNQLKRPWELICVDDGSKDNTLSHLCSLAATRPYLKVIAFAGNYGQSSAFDAGFKKARGDYVITMDGDLQNDPKDIPALIALTEDADLVCGWRRERRDSWTKKATSRLANAIRSRLCRDGVRDTGCSLKVYKRSCLEKIKLYHGMHRFLPALFLIEGFTVAETPVNHRPRKMGKTKYNFFNRSFNTIADMFAVLWMRRRQLRYKIAPSYNE